MLTQLPLLLLSPRLPSKDCKDCKASKERESIVFLPVVVRIQFLQYLSCRKLLVDPAVVAACFFIHQSIKWGSNSILRQIERMLDRFRKLVVRAIDHVEKCPLDPDLLEICSVRCKSWLMWLSEAGDTKYHHDHVRELPFQKCVDLIVEVEFFGHYCTKYQDPNGAGHVKQEAPGTDLVVPLLLNVVRKPQAHPLF